MFSYRFLCLIINCLILYTTLEGKLIEITPKQTTEKIDEILQAHASYKELNPVLIQRILLNYLEELDPSKTYFVQTDIDQWTDPSDERVTKTLDEMRHNDYEAFSEMQKALVVAILRRRELEKRESELPKNVKVEEFKDMKWVKDPEELYTRLQRIKGLQVETASKLSEETREKSLQRIEKRKSKFEEEMLTQNQAVLNQRILTMVLKAVAASLDSHTSYFTPDEATQFMINVQQRLFGIGAQLRDDINGFSVVKIIEGGPADGSELKTKDRIIAVDGEPVVGMDIEDAVELIRGEKETPVTLTVMREVTDSDGNKETQKIDVSLKRGEVVLKETRYESTYEPYGDGAIGYLRLYSFYQDPESSSSSDLAEAIRKLKELHNLKGLILDLRYNSGGMLSQAVSVTGLFITKGTVVSIKDENGAIQHLRDLDGKSIWEGPLVVLINRASASASEIVAQTLQDYGRALIIGDDHSFGKGSFQTFTLNTGQDNHVNPQGEYKVTRGRYYTVSGKSPQLVGVLSDIVVPGPLSEMDIGEKFSKFPLENDRIKENYDDDLSDVPFGQRKKIELLYKFDLQKKLQIYDPYIAILMKNSSNRILNNKSYQTMLKEIKKEDSEADEESEEKIGQNDLQLAETFSILKDLIYLRQIKDLQEKASEKADSAQK